MGQLINNKKGLTLIELIISIAIISIIAAAFIPLFVMSAKSNAKSETTLVSTYTGRDAMELIYSLSREVPYERLANELVKAGYSKLSDSEFGFKNEDDKYLVMKFTEEDNLIRALVKVYKDTDRDQVETQYESLFPWLGRGILK